MYKLEKVTRSDLYFRQWQYSLVFYLTDVSFIRKLNHDVIDESINYRNGWIAQRRNGNGPITDKTRSILHTACDYLLTRKHPYKKVVCGNTIWIYTNNLEDFDDIDQIPSIKQIQACQANLILAPDAITLKNPQHAFRTYFRERWLSDDELEKLRRYFNTRKGMFRLGPGFGLLVSGRRMWMMSNYFVDHNEPNADLLINMAVPGIVRKTLPIVGRAK